jgi:site-specific DNA-methyltransferase (adenine-specific)
MKPYYDSHGITIYHGSSNDVLSELDASSIDLVLTDPPYNTYIEEDIHLEGRTPLRRNFGEWDQDWTPDSVVPLVKPLMKPGASLVSFTSDKLLAAWKACGLTSRGTLVWVKTNPAPSARPCYVSATEWIIWLSKPGAAACWNADGYTLNVIYAGRCVGEERTDHPTQKPLEVVQPLILRHSNPNDLILDPYMGSGTTLRAAKNCGRRAIGIELDEHWCEVAARRCDNEGEWAPPTQQQFFGKRKLKIANSARTPL